MSIGTHLFTYSKLGIYSAIMAFTFIALTSCGGGGGQDYVEETLEDPTQGIKVVLQEQEKDLFKITDEEILEKREDSQIIANYMDMSSDTFSIDEVRLMSANDPQRSMMRSVAMAGMFGFMMGRPMSSGISRGAYASDGAYNKSNTAGRSQLSKTATRKTVRRATSKGYGSGKSTRSYGG